MAINAKALAQLESCSCPYCGGRDELSWAAENGFAVVKCNQCAYLYLNPRPNARLREQATQMGVHGAADDMDIAERFVPSKVGQYQKMFATTHADIWAAGKPITWLDIGAGYGEVVEAVNRLAPAGSNISGLEPMKVKAAAAASRGLNVVASFITAGTPKVQFASLINVFSHINNFDAFLQDASGVLLDRGELFIETGDMTDVVSRSDLPGDLGLPDHVAFAGVKHLSGFLDRNGFDVVSVDRAAVDDYLFTLKTVVKKVIGRDVTVKRPFSSPYRTMRVRARKRPLSSA